MTRSKKKPKANKKTVIEIWGDGVDVEYGLISPERGRELENYEDDEEKAPEDGYQSFYDQIVEIFDAQGTGFSGVTECSLFVDEKEIESFSVDDEQAKKKWPEEHIIVGDGVQWIVGEDQWSSGCWGMIEIDGDFDRSKLTFKVTSITFYDLTYACLEVFYDGAELEFVETHGGSGDYFFAKPGKRKRKT